MYTLLHTEFSPKFDTVFYIMGCLVTLIQSYVTSSQDESLEWSLVPNVDIDKQVIRALHMS